MSRITFQYVPPPLINRKIFCKLGPRFIMYFRSEFLEISKPIHFWNREITRDQKIIVNLTILWHQ